jgi:hypothetical protein
MTYPFTRWLESSSLARVSDDRPDLYDLRVRQLKLEVHPPIGWRQFAFMALVAAFVGAMLAVGGVL